MDAIETSTVCFGKAPDRGAGPVVLLNAPILTAEGRYDFRLVDLELARSLVRARGFESAIGHEQTARLISKLLEIQCPRRRLEFRQQPGQQALVFLLDRRLKEGQVLESIEEITSIGYSYALLTREA